MIGTTLFALLAVVCAVRGRSRLKRSKELAREARFRMIADQFRFVGYFLLLLCFMFAGLAIWCGVHHY